MRLGRTAFQSQSSSGLLEISPRIAHLLERSRGSRMSMDRREMPGLWANVLGQLTTRTDSKRNSQPTYYRSRAPGQYGMLALDWHAPKNRARSAIRRSIIPAAL